VPLVPKWTALPSADWSFGVGCLIAALWLEGGHLQQLVNLPAALIVLGGTFGATLIGLSVQQLHDLPHILRQALVRPSIDIPQTIRWLVTLSEKARRDGLLALEADANAASDEFLQRALQLAIDGTDPELLRDILQLEITFLEERHRQGEQVFTSMGGYAPTMGVLGTVMGLIHMMSRIENPEPDGPRYRHSVRRHTLRSELRQPAVPAPREQAAHTPRRRGASA
jgi:chemotaxis protein MotA